MAFKSDTRDAALERAFKAIDALADAFQPIHFI
jgi:hypothetical protein